LRLAIQLAIQGDVCSNLLELEKPVSQEMKWRRKHDVILNSVVDLTY